MAVIGTLAVVLKLNNAQFTSKMRESKTSVKKFSGGMGGAANMLKKFGGIAAVTAASLVVLRKAFEFGRATEEFNQALASSMAIMGDVSDVMRHKLVTNAHEVAFNTKFSVKETAAAYYYLISAGLDVERSIAALPQVALFAQAGMFDLATATELATDAQSSLGLKVDDATQNLANLKRVTDVLVAANSMADASAREFAEAFAISGSSLRLANKDIEEGISVLAVFADQGLKGAEAGTKLNIVLRDLQTKAFRSAKEFENAGIKVFNAAGEMRNMADIIEDIDKVLSKLTPKAGKKLLLDLGFTDKSVLAVQMLLGFSDELREYEERARAAGGITKEVADNQLPPFTKGWGKLKDAMARLHMPWMTVVLRDIGTVLATIGKVITWVAKAYETLYARAAKASDAFKKMAASAMDKLEPSLEKVKEAGVRLWKALGTLWDAFKRIIGESRLVETVLEFVGLAMEKVIVPATIMLLETAISALESIADVLNYVADVAERFAISLGGSMQDAKTPTDDLATSTEDLAAQQLLATKIAEAQARAVENVADATKKAETLQTKIFKAGASLTTSMATPFEKLQSRIKDANSLLSVGAITWKTYGREVAAVRKEMQELQAVGDARPEAAGRNTQAWFEALSRHRTMGGFGGGEQQSELDSLIQTEQPAGTNEVVAEAKRQNLQLAEQVRLLEAIKREAENQTALANMTFDETGQPYDVYPNVVDI